MVKNREERDSFISDNLGLVHAICKRFAGRGIEYDDLFQSGCMGLIKAADAFDFDRGVCFSTYAFPVIMGEIRRLFRDGGSVKVSRSIKELGMKTVKAKEKLEQSLMREPTLNEVANYLGVSTEEVSQAVCAANPTVSLTCEREDGTTEYQLPVNDEVNRITEKLHLIEGLKQLTKEEIMIINCRYFKFMTQNKTAKVLSMTQVQVSRKEKKILEKLKTILK